MEQSEEKHHEKGGEPRHVTIGKIAVKFRRYFPFLRIDIEFERDQGGSEGDRHEGSRETEKSPRTAIPDSSQIRDRLKQTSRNRFGYEFRAF